MCAQTAANQHSLLRVAVQFYRLQGGTAGLTTISCGVRNISCGKVMDLDGQFLDKLFDCKLLKDISDRYIYVYIGYLFSVD